MKIKKRIRMDRERVYFKTFGCRTNQFDTQIMISNLDDFNLAESESDADIVVINSCTVTNGADSSVRNYISSLERKNSSAKVILAGCGAVSKGEELFNKNRVFGVFGHSEKEKVNSLLKSEKRFYQVGDLKHIDKTIITEFVGKSRAFIKVQEGCDFRCSYCIIPYVRGNARSIPPNQIKEQIRLLASNGFGEFIITGTNVGSYGKDIGLSLAKLLKEISQIRGVRRVRVGSIEPIQIDDEFLELLNEPWFSRHLHIAIQHTSDKMLMIMNRRNRFKSDLELFEKIASKGIAIGTDFIVGHAGESEEIWQEAIERVKLMPLTHIHAFTYSKRDGTPSAKLKGEINGKIAKARLKELVGVINRKNYDFRLKHNRDLTILVDSQKDNIFLGYDQYFNRVKIESKEDLKGNWLHLESVEVKEDANYTTY
jgi:MiaB-like tRNA modifying enzyme